MNVEQRTRRVIYWGGPVVLLVGLGLLSYVAGAAAVAAAASAITALAAIGALWVAHRNLRHLVEDSRDRTRPYVYLELVPGLWGSAAVDLIVANFGESMAHDVTLEFKDIDWDAPLTAGEPDEVRPFIEKGLAGKSMVIPPHEGVIWSVYEGVRGHTDSYDEEVERAAGLAAARARGRHGGRPAKITGEQIRAAKRLYDDSELTVAEIGHVFGVSRATIYRCISAAAR